MKKTQLSTQLRIRIENRIGQIRAELELLKDDNTIGGLNKRADLMLVQAEFMELYK